MNFKSESGFTLMELMVVIGVLAILIAILLPQFTGYTAQAQAISAASEVKNALTAGYSYYVSVTSRDNTGAGYNGTTAEERMKKACGNTNATINAQNEAAATYQVTKGNLTFQATLDLTTGQVTGGEMTCTGDDGKTQDDAGSVCNDLKVEGALGVQ